MVLSANIINMEGEEPSAIMNNHGVRFLYVGNYQAAIDCFRTAIHLIRDSVETFHVVESTAEYYATTDAKRFIHSDTVVRDSHNPESSCSVLCVKQSPLAQHGLFSPQQQSSDTTVIYMHTQGFCLIPRLRIHSNDLLVNNTILSAMAFFNTALAFHLKALQFPDESTEQIAGLRQARTLYQTVPTLLEQVFECSGRQTTGFLLIDLLAMAVFNNLGIVSIQLQDRVSAVEHLKLLLGLLRAISGVEGATNSIPSDTVVDDDRRHNDSSILPGGNEPALAEERIMGLVPSPDAVSISILRMHKTKLVVNALTLLSHLPHGDDVMAAAA